MLYRLSCSGEASLVGLVNLLLFLFITCASKQHGTYFSLKALIQPPCNHAPGISLDSEDSPKTMAEGPAYQVAPASCLELDDPSASHVVLCVEFAGTVEGLEPQEPHPHLQRKQD